MSLELILQVVQAVAVVIGVVFALVQLRQLRAQRDVQAGIELLHPLRSPDAINAALLLNALPDKVGADEFRNRLGDQFPMVLGVLGSLESLGPLVARGDLPIDIYAELYRGATLLCWSKSRGYVEAQREAGWPNFLEWLQWLAERMAERTPGVNDAPAFERFKDWKASSDYNRLGHQS